MAWLKRNLLLVVGGVIALALLGVAGYYLYSQIGRYNEVTGVLTERTDKLNTLYASAPFPNQDNIRAAKAEEQRAMGYVEEVKKLLNAPAYPKYDIAEFKSSLEKSIVQLHREASNSGVRIVQPDYKFTFAAQRPLAQFQPGSLEPLTAQLEEIKQLCGILFRSSVHSLESIRRASVSSDDPANSADYLASKKITTNTTAGLVMSPYELIFYGFSSDLAAVMNGLQRSPQFFAVKYVVVDQAPASASPAPAAAPIMITRTPEVAQAEAPAAPMNPYGGMNEMMRRRYGLAGPGRGSYMPPPITAPLPPTTPLITTPVKQLTTVLDEKLLKFTLLVESTKLKPGK